MQLRTAGKKVPANDLKLPQHPSLLQRPRQSLLQNAKAAKAVAKVEGKDESFEKLKKVKSLQRLSFSVQRLHGFRQVVQHVQLHVSNWAARVN